MRRVLVQHSERLLGCRVGISAWRHVAIAISNRYLNEAFGRDGGDGEGDGDEDGVADSAWDLQAGHSTHVAGMIYAREMQQGAMGTAARRDQFRAVSRQWHRFLGFGSRDEAGSGTGRKRKREVFDGVREEARFRRFARLRAMDLEGQLQVMLGDGARFRGIQQKVIQAIVRGDNPIVQVTGTGGGKSLSFMLPAFCSPEGVTVVVVPLVALREDLHRRCQKSGIDTHVWEGRGHHRAASILFVTPESVVTQAFQMFINRLYGRGQLDRVVVDECHTVLDSNRSFRPQMALIGGVVRGFGVQVVFLTATLSPGDVGRFYHIMGLEGRHVRMFRERTTRRTIRYRVHQAAGGREDEDKAVCRVVQEGLAGATTGKIIVYGGQIERVERLGRMLSCAVYYGRVDSVAGKARRLQEWMESGQVIVTTNALGMGVDIPDVRMVVHAGPPRWLRAYAQESGRAGRDGVRSEAVVVWAGPGPRKEGDEQEGGWLDKGMEAFLQGRGCRRAVLDSVMDGFERPGGCEEGEERCDRCMCEEEEEVEEEVVEEVVEDEVVEEVVEEEVVEDEVKEMEGVEEVKEEREWEESGVGGEDEVEEKEEVENTTRGKNRKDTHLAGFFQLRRREIREQQKVTEKAVQEAEEVEVFKRLLESWVGRCAACWLLGRQDTDHTMERCPRQDADIWAQVQYVRDQVKKEVFGKRRLEKYSGCFYCGVPQLLCGRWAANGGEGGRFILVRGGVCQYGEAILWMFSGLTVQGGEKTTRVIEGMMAEVGDSGDKEWYVWLGRLVRWGGLQASQICRVCVHLEQKRL
jgi:superfamily II DNA helicase RecQ